MRRGGAGWLAWLVWALAVALLAVYVPLRVAAAVFVAAPDATVAAPVAQSLGLSAITTVEDPFLHGTYLAFSTLGALIVSRRTGNRVGWLFCAVGLLGALVELAGYYAIDGLVVAPGALPGALAAAWLNNWLWVPYTGLLCVFLPLLFPTGRLPSER